MSEVLVNQLLVHIYVRILSSPVVMLFIAIAVEMNQEFLNNVLGGHLCWIYEHFSNKVVFSLPVSDILSRIAVMRKQRYFI